MDLGAKELHAEDVRLLAPDVDHPHVDDAFEAQQRARGRGRDAMLARPRLGDHPPLPHPLRQQRLADRAVDLVRAGMREVLALQEHARETDRLRETGRIGERGRPADPIAK